MTLKPVKLEHCGRFVRMWDVYDSSGNGVGVISIGPGGWQIARSGPPIAAWVGSFGVGLQLLRALAYQ